MSIDFQALYYREPYRASFAAKVLDVSGPDPEGLYQVVLEESAFYPEGGGQPGDRGHIGPAQVLDTRFVGGRQVQITDRPLTVGETYPAHLDFDRRFEFMQQHTGEHLISGLAKKHFGARNVGFHINETEMTLDFDVPLKASDVAFLEQEANEVVFRNLPVDIVFPPLDQLADLDYRSKKALDGPVRLVQVEGVDNCACCGTHLARTGEIGLLKIVDSLKYKGGVRLTALCGRRALRDYRQLQDQAQALSQLYSLKSRELLPSLEQPLRQIGQAEEIIKWRSRQLLTLLADQAATRPLLLWDNFLDKQNQKSLAKWIGERGAQLVLIFCPLDDQVDHYRYVFHAADRDLAQLHAAFKASFAVQGGGKAGFYQGQVEAAQADMQAFFAGQLGDIFIYQTQGEL